MVVWGEIVSEHTGRPVVNRNVRDVNVLVAFDVLPYQ